MKTIIILNSLAAACLAMALSGCSSMLTTVNQNTPHTTFDMTLDGHHVGWKSPKDTVATNIDFCVSSNGVSLKISYISSTQNTNAISDTAQVIAAQGVATVDTLNAAANLAGAMAAKAATTAAK